MSDIDDIFLIQVVERGPAGNGFTTAEATVVRNDLNTMLARPVITTLDSLTDVVVTAPAEGHVVKYNAATSQWLNAAQQAGIVAQHNAVNVVAAATILNSEIGVRFYATGTPGMAALEVLFAGSGSASTVARSDHAHNAPAGKRGSFVATGVLSSGTRSLVNTTFGPLLSGITYDVDARFLVRARNNVNNGTFNLLCRVGSAAGYPQLSRNVQTVGGVPVDQHIDFGDANGDMVIVGAGATVPITFDAQFSSGDAVDLRDGNYRVIAKPRR